MKNELIVSPINFQLIIFDHSRNKNFYLFRDINKFDMLLVLKNKKFKKFPINLNDILACCMTSNFLLTSERNQKYLEKIQDKKLKVKNEFEIQGFVHGYEVLNLSTLSKHWISYIDLEDLQFIDSYGCSAFLSHQ